MDVPRYLISEMPFCRSAENHGLFLMEQIDFHLRYAALAKQKDFNIVGSISSPVPGALPADVAKWAVRGDTYLMVPLNVCSCLQQIWAQERALSKDFGIRSMGTR